MKLFKPLFLLLITFLKAYSQEASIKHINFLPVSEQVKNSQNLNHQKALPFMQKPYELLNYWGDQTLPIAQYSEKEKAFQQHLNHVLSDDFVLSYSPESIAFEEDNYNLPLNERNIDNEPITPYTWKWVRFELIHEDGSKDEVKLCRPNWWLNNLGANKVGEKVYLDIPETGINGTALVTKILPCQLDTRLLNEKREGEYVYRPITATFKHQSAEVWDFTFKGDETIGATNNHPFYSLDRQDYIPVGELRIGERVKNFAGTEIKLLSKAKRPNPEPVYNLEVYRDHNYLVGKGKILVHNTYIDVLSTESIKGVKLLSGFISKNGDELDVSIGLIYKQDGYTGSVFENLLNHLDDLGKEHGTKSLRITFETITDVATRDFYKAQAAKYGFKISYKLSPVSSKAAPALDIIWTK